MLDARILAERRDEIVESCRRRRVTADVDGAIAAREQVAALQTELQQLNRTRKEHQSAGKMKLADKEREAHVSEGRRIKDEVGAVEAQLDEAETTLQARLAEIPNFIHPDVPIGGEEDFREIRRVGSPRDFDFDPVDHLVICDRLDLVDFEGGARVTGQKFYFLKNEMVLLDLALQRFALNIAIEAGFVPHTTPDLARRTIVDAMAFSPRGEETQIYSVEGTDLDLVGTAEITLGGLYADALLQETDLPLKLVGISHCFRTEAGAHGRESKGLYRVHQFTKVEMFVLCRPEDSEAMHEQILKIEERILQALEIPYRVIDVASGDLGAPAYRKYDIEAWMPGRGEAGDFGEVTSASNCTDFQARRLKARFRRAVTKKNELVHTLNGTAVALSRTPVALLENHQQADGSVTIPKALQPNTGFDRIGPR
ncbi:MAG: serine--tRNA ligase [Deltaproteobacteria bacterium]|nr:serine--tRNA ligase [Myxococcales bacterium]TDJ14079.1 MAG: serine--tRNA ligase [Deltaproteobacteria bacterium]